MVTRTRREKSPERRRQIVEATLGLLASTPIERLTTRDIAEVVGVSQPALFRHFTTRDDLLAAAVDTIREELGNAVACLLSDVKCPLDRAERLFHLLYVTASERPGLVRLLLADTATGEGTEYRAALDYLSSLQEELVTTLVREARDHGELPSTLDCREAARVFVALAQGTLISRLRYANTPARQLSPHVAFRCWRAALNPGEPKREATTPVSQPPAAAMRRLDALDVRPILADGDDPLGHIRQRLAGLADDGVLLLTAPFEPRPLIHLLGDRGYRMQLEQRRPGVYSLLVSTSGAPELVDLSDLPAPEPLERALEETAQMDRGQARLFRVPQHPNLLLPRLSERGLSHEVALYEDGAALVHVRRPDDGAKPGSEA